MKGTFFSADFVEDSTGNLRLLEVNTDTTISDNNLVHINFDNFVSLLESNNITKVTVVHKPVIHQGIVDKLSEYLTANAPFITEFNEVKEQQNRIYPTSVVDASDLFILRMAYDESAIFDSEFAKINLNVFKLFLTNDEPTKIPEFYYSSSEEAYNTIVPELNASNLPDLLIKQTSDVNHTAIEFYKMGSESAEDTIQTKWDTFVSTKSNDGVLIEKYHVGPNTVSENKISSVRTYSIIYGSDLSLIHVGQFEEKSVFELPTESIYNENEYVNKIDTKHYYEFATNFIKSSNSGKVDGILNTHLIIKSDDTEVEIGSVAVGDEIKSYYIGGTDLTADDFTYPTWKIDGNTLPSGSILSTSTIIYKNTKELLSKTLVNLTVNNNEDSLYVSQYKSFLVYDSEMDGIVWKQSVNIKTTSDYLVDYDGSLAQVTNSEILIINEDNFSLVEIDVEDTDTYIIAGSTPINSFVTHNAPCFVAGTQIKTGEGFKSIEDIVIGDFVLTWNFEKEVFETKEVKNIFSKLASKTVKYYFENEVSVECTLDHPIYVKDKGWCSYEPTESNSKYSLESPIVKIEIGDDVHTLYGNLKLTDIIEYNDDVMVYNLHEVEDNNNFFANDVLVHNRFVIPKL